MSGEWQPLDGDTRGTVTSLASGQSGRVYAATSVGVYCSEDAGGTWSLASSGSSVPFCECVAVEDNTLPLRLREGSSRGEDGRVAPLIFVGARDGLYRSDNDGQTWQPVLVASRVTAVCARTGVLLAGTDTDGVLRSEEAGRTWSGANAGLLDLEVLAMALAPDFASSGLGFVGTPSGLFRTRNRAESWRIVDTGLDDTVFQCVAIGPNRFVVAGTEADGLVCSHDAGATWQAALPGSSVSAVAISPHGIVVAATNAGIVISFDAGLTWREHASGPTRVLSLLCLDDKRLLAACERTGIWCSTDGGTTWRCANAGLHASLLSSLAIAEHEGVYVAGPTEGVRAWRDGTWREVKLGLPDTTVLGLSIASRGQCFVATTEGVYATLGDDPWTLTSAPAPARAVFATDHLVIAAFEDGPIRLSADGGRSWRTLKAPFSGATVLSVAIDQQTLLVATAGQADTTVWRSTDAGQRWNRWFVHPARLSMLPITASPVVMGLAKQVLRADLRSTQLPSEVTSLASRDNTVLAGTSSGLFMSRDGGESYAPCAGPKRIVAVGASATAAYALELGGRLWRRRQ